jgi:hypothetical protein
MRQNIQGTGANLGTRLMGQREIEPIHSSKVIALHHTLELGIRKLGVSWLRYEKERVFGTIGID